MATATHGDGDGHGIGHALDGAGSHGMAHGTATAEVGEGGAAGHHGFEQGAQHGVRAGVPAGGRDADAVTGLGGGIQTGHGGGDLGVDVEAVHRVDSHCQIFFRVFLNAAGRCAEDGHFHSFQLFDIFDYCIVCQLFRLVLCSCTTNYSGYFEIRRCL